MATLREELGTWNEKSVGAIETIYSNQHTKRGFAGSLIRLSGEPDLEVGATWLIKHHLESGGALTTAHATAFYKAARGFLRWGARLHALQIMEHVPIPGASIRDAKRLIETGLADENKFVRAWAYNGFVRLAEGHPRYRNEAEQLLTDAEATESAASVRARVRQIRKRLK